MPVPSALESASFAHQKRIVALGASTARTASSSSSGVNTPCVNSSERSRPSASTSTPTRAFAATTATTKRDVCAIERSMRAVRRSPHSPIGHGLPLSSAQICTSASLHRAW